MQLKRLELIGFKTFADRTEIEIDSGMTAIVGPNGCGKSNIVDALLWVLGEQNPRLLRGATAQDVIFAGTDRRKPLGMAEVRLTIDNSDHGLPIDFEEVTVSRRVFRSGESQYLINGAQCRLKDVVELFLDTGAGKGAYAFVSQSEVDAVLSARPEDRRELFEEAAGVKKYRTRKREALRKLESAEANLTRIRDILQELDAEREPMERQAVAARRYLLLQERLHEIEVGLLVGEVQKSDYELFALRQERDADVAAVRDLEEELARLEGSASELGEGLARSEADLEEARQAHHAAASLVDRLDGERALMGEREAGATRSRAQLERELADLADRAERLTTAIGQSEADLGEAGREESERRESLVGQRAALAELDEAVRAGMRQSQERQNERMRLERDSAARDASLTAARDRLADASVRLDAIRNDIGRLESAGEEARGQAAAARAAAEACEQECVRLAEERAGLQERIAGSQERAAATRASLDGARRRLAEQSSRFATLRELHESHEGFYQGVRAVLTARKSGGLSGHFVAVVDMLNVPEPYRVAVEVALGGSLQDIVTETEEEAKAGIDWLKRQRAGRATFLPLPLLRPPAPLRVESSAGGANGVHGVAADLVSIDPRYADVLRLLLGRALIVSDMDAAIAASRRMQGWNKIVTLEGELLTPGGALTGGSLQGRGTHLVGRKGELDDLKSRLPKAQREVDELSRAADAIAAEIQSLDSERSALLQRESEAQAKRASASSARASAERDGERLGRELADRRAARADLEARAGALEAEIAEISTAIEAGRKRNDSADDALSALEEETRALALRRDTCRTAAVTLEVDVSRLAEKRQALTRELAADRAELVSIGSQAQRRREQREALEGESVDSVQAQAKLAIQLADARERLAGLETALASCRELRQGLLARNAEMSAALKSAGHRRNEITASLHQAEMSIVRLEERYTQATERLQMEYGISVEEALARPEDVAADRNTIMEVNRLRRELRAMGTVNTGAVAEFERLTERSEFLSTQRDDLERGRVSLLQTIAEIDESTRGVFMETFEAVRVEFERLFTRLFGGGTTRLELTKPDDLLETGIEVIAQPPGKRAQSLSLLSGGERALTATALLFAFLAVRPSPFVLLDEVDAPLDGVNVEKFAGLVRDFSRNSQFLLITHNPTTMETAPAWYGVTMRDPGVSSVIAYRVPQEALPSDGAEAVVIMR